MIRTGRADVSELFPGKIGDATGTLPMVGYGAGAYVLHILERERMAKDQQLAAHTGDDRPASSQPTH